MYRGGRGEAVVQRAARCSVWFRLLARRQSCTAASAWFREARPRRVSCLAGTFRTVQSRDRDGGCLARPFAMVSGRPKGYRRLRSRKKKCTAPEWPSGVQALEGEPAFGKALFEGDEGFGGGGHGPKRSAKSRHRPWLGSPQPPPEN